jgi:4-phytase/acid phosphatase/peptide/nickel transport system substrate-binding protein
MFANFYTGSPANLAQYSNPELDALLLKARTTADIDKRIGLYCEISRLINKEAVWYWTFQNTYYALSTAKVKGLPKMYSGVIDVSRTWKE